jgi:amino acid adenylation domain-containing protein
MSSQEFPGITVKNSINISDSKKDITRIKSAKHKYFDALHHNYRYYPNTNTIYEVFQECVKKYPSKVAISYNGESLTYAELNSKANQLARYVRSQYKDNNGKEITPDTLVTVLVDRSLDMIVSIIGVLKSGAAYVPIDYKSPDQRITYIVNDTQCSLIITESKYVTRVEQCLKSLSNKNTEKNFKTKQILLDEQKYLREPCDNLKSYSKYNDLAYIIYTSGTTGRPKGVMIEHHSVLNLCSSRQRDYGIDANSVVLQFSPIAFDCSVCEIFSALLNGAKLTIIDDTTKRDSELLIDYFLSEKISVATFLPSLLSQLALIELPEFPHLKTIIAAGEACTSDVISTWRKKCNLIIGYGPTETTVCSTLNTYKEDDLPNNIGKPIQNTCIYILKDNLEPADIGETGEICVSGVSLARGYLNQPETTAEKFIDNPFVKQIDKDNGYSKIYKTGDLARWLDDGRIEYIGRNDAQVKIRGHRIGLEEIQMELLRYPGVMQVLVHARDRELISSNTKEESLSTGTSTKYLVVYYLSDSVIQSEKFVEHLSQRLPDYMIPSYYIKLDYFPQTLNGKIDSHALPDPMLDTKLYEYIAPSTKLEEEICEIWKSVLGLDLVGVKSDFFNIGGDSLLVISLVAFINSKYGIKINATMINDHTTVSSQADLVKERQALQEEFYSDKGLELITMFRAKRDKNPLFFIHPSLTGASVYSDMVNWLDEDQPFYGIESYNLSHLSSPVTDMEKLATLYADAIREIQTNGPYQLGGYSAGGNIAFEIANQLIKTGQNVEKMYLIDSVQPKSFGRKDKITHDDTKEFLEFFGFNPADKNMLELAKIELSLLFSYYPKSRLPIKVILFKASNIVSSMDSLHENHVARYFFQPDEKYSSWDRFAQEVTKYEIEANHHSIVDYNNLHQITNIIQNDIKSQTF